MGVSFSDITNAAISTGDITVNGATAADVSHAVLGAYKQGIAESAEQIRELSGKLGITEKAIVGFLETLHEAPIALELIPAKFQELAARYQRLLDTVRTLQSDDSEVQRLRTGAATAIETGPALYDQAEELLERAEAIDRGATEQLAAALEARKLSAAASRMQRGELSLVRLDYESAIDHFKAATETVPSSHPEVHIQYRLAYANALYEYGKDRGVNSALARAIDTFRDALLERTREQAPLQWAATQNNLEIALRLLEARRQGSVIT